MPGKRGQVSRPNMTDMKIRLPADLREQIEAASKDNGSSMNGEIVSRLEQSFLQTADIPQDHLRPIMRNIAFDIWRLENKRGASWLKDRVVAHGAAKIASDYFRNTTRWENQQALTAVVEKSETLRKKLERKLGYLLEVGAIGPKEEGRSPYSMNALMTHPHNPEGYGLERSADAIEYPPSKFGWLVHLLDQRGLRLLINLGDDISHWTLSRAGEAMPEAEKVGVAAVLSSLEDFVADYAKLGVELREAEAPEKEAEALGKKLAASLSGGNDGP